MKSETITFKNGDVSLVGTLHVPQGGSKFPCVIVYHGASMGEKTDPFYAHLRTRLPEGGVAVFLFDRRGSGASGGVFETADFEDLAADGLAAFGMLRTRSEIDADRIFVYGISQGGWIAPIAAARETRIAGVVIVSGSGVSPARQMDYATEYTMETAGFGSEAVAKAVALRGQVNDYFRGKVARADLQRELAKAENETWFEPANVWDSASLPEDVTTSKWYYELDFPPVAIWDRVQQPTLFIFPGHDRWVPITESMEAFRAATTHLKDVEFAQIEGADHLMHDDETAGEQVVSEKYLTTLTAWLKKHSDAKTA